MIDLLKEMNRHVELESVHSASFGRYGKVLNRFPHEEIAERMMEIPIPVTGNEYVPSLDKLEAGGMKKYIESHYFGGMPIQIGYCNGINSSLGGLEFHKGSEINVAITDFILLLGHTNELVKDTYNVANIKAFFVPCGAVIEMYQTTLHLAPCKVNDRGFKCVVILPKGTNTPLADEEKDADPLLFMKNKWLIAHSEHTRFVEQGAHEGIIGENITIAYPTEQQRGKLYV
ncbi:DUF4867 family protein [Sporosarcina cascadiensis]|uniref:DUF4867 family protein n=1 Tax=Sporosarcina cascadiensis TaxID=2660747 RepID=UPI00129B1B7C|nr:DUF4867 family protein [Sporosarcina cascadiensis]